MSSKGRVQIVPLLEMLGVLRRKHNIGRLLNKIMGGKISDKGVGKIEKIMQKRLF